MSDLLADTGHRVLTVQARMQELLARARARSQSFSPAYEQLWESLEAMADGGKKIRPRLMMDAYTALGGTDDQIAVDAACAMELLHMALLIHDDVIDRDVKRRGEPNITGRFATDAMARGATPPDALGWGEASSILAGDLMLTMAHSLLARLDVPAERRQAALDLFEDTVFESAAGEQQDVWLSLRLEQASPDDVLTMVEQKTAAYSFQAPLALAALLAGAPSPVVEELSAIARRIGVIYQLRDDVLGLFGDEQHTGKSTLSDLREGKETLLVAYARIAPAWSDVAHLLGDGALGDDDGQRIRRVIRDSHALTLVEAIIAERCDVVHALIEDSSLPPALRDQLTALTHACSARES